MLIVEAGTFQFRCDICMEESDRFLSMEALLKGTNFNKSVYFEPIGWLNLRENLQVTQDEAVQWSDQFRAHRGVVIPDKHIGPKCRMLYNMYYP